MGLDLSDPVALGLALWGAAGIGVALVFLTVGIDRIDPAARGAFAVRPILVPGIVLLWPVVLLRWWALERGTRRR